MGIKILIADNHGILREGIQALIEKHSDIEVIGQAENGLKVVEMACELHPDVVLMDVTMPELNGIEATRQISGKLPDVKVLALSIHARREFVQDMIKAGASGYMLKECVFEDLIRAIKTVFQGQSYLSPKIANIVLEDIKRGGILTADNSSSDVLNPRELQILQLLAEGKTAKQVALKLDVSVKTIEASRRHIMEKIDVNNIADLIKYAIRQGLTTI